MIEVVDGDFVVGFEEFLLMIHSSFWLVFDVAVEGTQSVLEFVL